MKIYKEKWQEVKREKERGGRERKRERVKEINCNHLKQSVNIYYISQVAMGYNGPQSSNKSEREMFQLSPGLPAQTQKEIQLIKNE